MSDVKRIISRLQTDLDSYVDPQVAVIDIQGQLDVLRQIYKIRPADFTSPDLDSLRRVALLTSLVDNLALLIDDAAAAHSKEFALETANSLAGLAQSLQGMRLGQLAQAQARSLRDKARVLPSDVKGELGRIRRISKTETDQRLRAADALLLSLDRVAPRCSFCGVPMKPRTGRHGDFWGCVSYPECTQTAKMSDEAISMFVEMRGLLDSAVAIRWSF